jgi:hypothetical protein
VHDPNIAQIEHHPNSFLVPLIPLKTLAVELYKCDVEALGSLVNRL